MKLETLEEVRAFFAKDRFAGEIGAVIDEIGDYYAKCSINLDDRHKNAVGGVMGGVYFTLADFAFAVATNIKEQGTVSLNASIAFLGPVKGEMLIAEAHCIKEGKTTSYYQIDLKDEKGNLSAVVHITGFHKG